MICLDRFDQVPIKAGGVDPDPPRFVIHCRDSQKNEVPATPTQSDGHLVTVHPRHVNVDQADVGKEFGCLDQSSRAAVGGAGIETGELKEHNLGVRRVTVVVHAQHSAEATRCG